MKFIAILLRHASIQFLWGTLIAFIITSIWGSNGNQISDNLCIGGIVFMIFIGPIFLKPQEIGIDPSSHEMGGYIPGAKFESTNNDDTLVGLPEKEQKKYLSLDYLIVMVKTFGIGFTLLFYSMFGS